MRLSFNVLPDESELARFLSGLFPEEGRGCPDWGAVNRKAVSDVMERYTIIRRSAIEQEGSRAPDAWPAILLSELLAARHRYWRAPYESRRNG